MTAVIVYTYLPSYTTLYCSGFHQFDQYIKNIDINQKNSTNYLVAGTLFMLFRILVSVRSGAMLAYIHPIKIGISSIFSCPVS